MPETKRKKVRRESPLEGYFDVIIAQGMISLKARVSQEGINALWTGLVLGGQDVILRAENKNHEHNVVLRGDHPLEATTAPPNPANTLAVYDVRLASDYMAEVLDQIDAGDEDAR